MVIAVLTNCNKRKKRRRRFAFVFTRYSYNSKDTILITNTLKLNNGIYFFNSKPYSGYIKEILNQVKCILVLNGQQQGLSLVYFVDGKLKNRSYKDGKVLWRHFEYWDNGNQDLILPMWMTEEKGQNNGIVAENIPFNFQKMIQRTVCKMHGTKWKNRYINYSRDGVDTVLKSTCVTLKRSKLKDKSND
jgi:hypothetical protein